MVVSLAAISIGNGTAQQNSNRASSDAPPERGFASQYCLACHNAKTKSGGLDLDALLDEDFTSHPAQWEKVIRNLRARYMPPAGLPRPDDATYKSVVASLEAKLDRAAVEHPNPGRTDTFRRLNRTEYHNTIRELLSLDVDVTSLLPTDESSHGFDNVTDGRLSPTLLDRYVSAAEKISRLAVGRPMRAPGGVTVVLRTELSQEAHFEDLPVGTRGGAAIPYTFPLDGEYEFQVRLTRDRNEEVEGLGEPQDVELLIDNERVQVFTVKLPPAGQDHHLVDVHMNARLQIKAGPHIIGATFADTSLPVLETEIRPFQSHFNIYRHPRVNPAIYSVAVNGPFAAVGPGDTPSRRRIFVCNPQKSSGEEACASRILTSLMRRAYRRAATPADLRKPLEFFRRGRAEGGFDAGIEAAVSAVLVNLEFLFRFEPDPAGVAPKSAYRISDEQLASRLSFFLWSSIPDDELLNLATQGKLHAPGVLEQQTRRMLADQRSQALISNFAGQWLFLRDLAAISPDMRLFPDFDDNLRQALRRETEMFFESILREDRSTLDLLRANYTFLNERVAKHYGIPNIYGSRFRRVNLSADSVRGGLLRQGSILAVTSYANRTSPVVRGKWILENFLGLPPPPPPPGVPALKENTALGREVPVRERMAQHRSDPACAGCHRLMDPVGLSLENYDAVGRWRATENNRSIDSTGGLPDGSKFEGVRGLERALLSRPELFVGTLTEKLLTYALGRGVEAFDAPAVRRIMRGAEVKEYPLSSLVLGVVNSAPFQMRRAQ